MNWCSFWADTTPLCSKLISRWRQAGEEGPPVYLVGPHHLFTVSLMTSVMLDRIWWVILGRGIVSDFRRQPLQKSSSRLSRWSKQILFWWYSYILTGWDDGKIRSFTPESGKLLYVIDNAHQIGVTAIATTHSSCSTSTQIISGGGEGEVRVWSVRNCKWKLQEAMKEKHKGKQKN